MLKVAIGSVGAVGEAVARRLDGGVQGLELVAVSAQRKEAAAERLANLKHPVPVLDIEQLAAQVVHYCRTGIWSIALAKLVREFGCQAVRYWVSMRFEQLPRAKFSASPW